MGVSLCNSPFKIQRGGIRLSRGTKASPLIQLPQLFSSEKRSGKSKKILSLLKEEGKHYCVSLKKEKKPYNFRIFAQVSSANVSKT